MKTIQLTNKFKAKIDDEDFLNISKFKWYAKHDGHNYYAVRNSRKSEGNPRRTIFMHNCIISVPEKMVIDHIDHDTLNNQKSNLRICTFKDNSKNKSSHKDSISKYMGVTWNKRLGKWNAKIVSDSKSHHLGTFIIEEDAARAYDKAAVFYFGEFANLNFK